jgi:hypothetical protein
MSVLSDTDAIARVGHAKTYYAYTDGTYSKPGVWFYTRIRTAHIYLFLQTQVFHAIRLGFQYPSGVLTKKSTPRKSCCHAPDGRWAISGTEKDTQSSKESGKECSHEPRLILQSSTLHLPLGT